MEIYVQQGGFDSFCVDGDVSNKQEVGNTFAKCCKTRWAVMCATTLAAGVGLNMQAANCVVFTDIGYSPNAQEEQSYMPSSSDGVEETRLGLLPMRSLFSGRADRS